MQKHEQVLEPQDDSSQFILGFRKPTAYGIILTVCCVRMSGLDFNKHMLCYGIGASIILGSTVHRLLCDCEETETPAYPEDFDTAEIPLVGTNKHDELNS